MNRSAFTRAVACVTSEKQLVGREMTIASSDTIRYRRPLYVVDG